jgi:hypothetical protein
LFSIEWNYVSCTRRKIRSNRSVDNASAFYSKLNFDSQQLLSRKLV